MIESIKTLLTATIGGGLSFINLKMSFLGASFVDSLVPTQAIIGIFLGVATLVYTILKINEMLCKRRDRLNSKKQK